MGIKQTKADTNKIIFFQDDKTALVRPIEDIRKDYEALARCFNSFKDSDSWPGGFGGAFEFTGDFLQKQNEGKDTATQFVVVAPEDKAKIVGVSFCSPTWNIPNGWYIQLLGVDPEYQGRKLGKALLIHSCKLATDKKAKVLTLHTWGGNLKAMPLYKRQGFKWRPNTSVYMENYIPQILNYPYFNNLFTKFSWYDTFKANITQEPDDRLDEQMQIYQYHFDMSEKTSLTVWIDRTNGSICGFHKKSEKEDICIKARTPNSEAFIGFETFPLTVSFKNNGKKTRTFRITPNATNNINLNKEETQTIKIEPGQKEKLAFKGIFNSKTQELDLRIYTHTLTKHFVTFNIEDDQGKIFPIKVGKIPLNAINVLTSPLNFSVKPNSSSTLVLHISNSMINDIDVHFDFNDGEKVKLEETSFIKTISKYDSQIEIPLTIELSKTMVDNISLVAKSSDGKIYQKKTIPILIFNQSKVLSYRIDNCNYLENKYFRLSFFDAPQPGNNQIEIIDKLHGISAVGNQIVLGYPFDSEGSEFYSKPLEHQLQETETGTWLYSSASSDIKQGLSVTRKIFLPNDYDLITFQTELTNTSDAPIENLGILNYLEYSRDRKPWKKFVIPYDNQIIEESILDLPLVLEAKPKKFFEGWIANVYANGTLGFLFNPKSLKKLHTDYRYPRFEYKWRKLQPGKSIETKPFHYYFCTTWQEVRKKWLEEHDKIIDYVEYYKEAKPALKFGLATTSTSSVVDALVIDKNNSKVNIKFKTPVKMTLKGDLQIDLNNLKINPRKIKLRNIHTNNWEKTVSITKPDEKIATGKITYKSEARDYEFPISLITYKEKEKIAINKKQQNNHDFWEITNGFLSLKTSSEFKGNAFSLQLKENGNENLFLTNYPEIKPFFWYNEFYGGIGTIMQPIQDAPGLEKFYRNITFSASKIKQGLFRGMRFTSNILNYHPGIKGLQLKIDYLLLPQAPFFLLRVMIHNHSNIKRKAHLRIETALKTSPKAKDHYLTKDKNNQIITYRLQDYESSVRKEMKILNKWAAMKRTDLPYYLGISNQLDTFNSRISCYSPDFRVVFLANILRNVEIKPKKEVTLPVCFFLSKDLEAFDTFKNNNILELIKK